MIIIEFDSIVILENHVYLRISHFDKPLYELQYICRIHIEFKVFPYLKTLIHDKSESRICLIIQKLYKSINSMFINNLTKTCHIKNCLLTEIDEFLCCIIHVSRVSLSIGCIYVTYEYRLVNIYPFTSYNA